MTDTDLLAAAQSSLGSGFAAAVDRSSGERALAVTCSASGVTYRGSYPDDNDDGAWNRIIASLKRNHIVAEWVRTHGPWTAAQAQAAGWPVQGSMAIATMPDGSSTIVELSP